MPYEEKLLIFFSREKCFFLFKKKYLICFVLFFSIVLGSYISDYLRTKYIFNCIKPFKSRSSILFSNKPKENVPRSVRCETRLLMFLMKKVTLC